MTRTGGDSLVRPSEHQHTGEAQAEARIDSDLRYYSALTAGFRACSAGAETFITCLRRVA